MKPFSATTIVSMRPLTWLNYVFGYGSLICSRSRSLTAPETLDREVTPVLVHGLERTWAKRSTTGMTAMGVRFQEGAECVGVFLPLTDSELLQFDEREKGYDRMPLRPADIEPVPFLDPKHYQGKQQQQFLRLIKERPDDVCLWVYVQQENQYPTPEHPIVQTYVDTILRGCLSISDEFATEFIKNTKGWHPEEIPALDDESAISSSESEDDGSVMFEPSWIDDRDDPVYIRGDPTYSRQNSDDLDQLLKKHRPGHFRHRRSKSA
ncbi:hypothetical protein FisN_5Lh233 [Fistulifera solaris]|uniref:Gamma-glutamylcyclotransferase AIG2-like domain-containing protein n=1 Tax=Fistulifera solaris TaxID=1519565 RepID=A0A1Z5JJ52_FISSO|nr:hypothetical protein FisN_5Lh233 [Fistulifera solaris]|eukprot:GAX13872.1 hypothetical protein FisN_5Lh233 [Fistulifera solaris]